MTRLFAAAGVVFVLSFLLVPAMLKSAWGASASSPSPANAASAFHYTRYLDGWDLPTEMHQAHS